MAQHVVRVWCGVLSLSHCLDVLIRLRAQLTLHDCTSVMTKLNHVVLKKEKRKKKWCGA